MKEGHGLAVKLNILSNEKEINTHDDYTSNKPLRMWCKALCCDVVQTLLSVICRRDPILKIFDA